MRFYRSCFISIFLLLVLSYSTTAQEQAKEKPTPKIAFIDTSIFADEKGGISRYVRASEMLFREFQGYRESLVIKAKIESIENEIKNASSSLNAETLKAKQEEIIKLQKLYNEKEREWKKAFERRQNEILKPIEEDINKELKAFVNQKGFIAVIDLNTNYWPCFLEYDEDFDITKEFIAYYNARHPVTNSQTQVKLSEPK
jgi:Skp family chaperone for outer membrane proteins